MSTIAWATATFLAGLIVRHLLSSYLAEKGKNLATKEDVGEITNIIESTKLAYQRDIAELQEALKASTSLRFLAAEKRLEVHQQAFYFASQMLQRAFEDDVSSRNKLEAQWADFWQRNCLYLDKAVQEAFPDAASAFHIHMDMVKDHRGKGEYFAGEVKNNMQRIRSLIDEIKKAVDLPSIGGALAGVTDSETSDSAQGLRS